jgi:hypothetical protein
MNKRRLLKLADLLEADAENKEGIKFDLHGWGWTEDDTVSQSCGTTACAMGLAVLSGAFKRAGLKNGSSNRNEIDPVIGRRRGFDAAEKLFDLTETQSRFLFSVDRYPLDRSSGAVGEHYVAKRIRDFVAGKVAP